MGLTSVFLYDSSQCKMKDLKIGMILEDGSRIICMQKFKTTLLIVLFMKMFLLSL